MDGFITVDVPVPTRALRRRQKLGITRDQQMLGSGAAFGAFITTIVAIIVISMYAYAVNSKLNDNLPCQNGGVSFTLSNGTKFCECPRLYIGFLCDEVNPQPCYSGTNTSFQTGTYNPTTGNCICITGYIGQYCQTPYPVTCLNGGINIENLGTGFRCFCPNQTWTGEFCEIQSTQPCHPVINYPNVIQTGVYNSTSGMCDCFTNIFVGYDTLWYGDFCQFSKSCTVKSESQYQHPGLVSPMCVTLLCVPLLPQSKSLWYIDTNTNSPLGEFDGTNAMVVADPSLPGQVSGVIWCGSGLPAGSTNPCTNNALGKTCYIPTDCGPFGFECVYWPTTPWTFG